MESFVDSLSKTFTRFFMPGLIFISFSILPLVFLNKELIVSLKGNYSLSLIIIASLIFGYLLDSAGAYSWTIHFAKYNRTKDKLSKKLSSFSKKESDDPDSHITLLWLKNEQLYERIFLERAEWVLILETAFALIISSFVVLAYSIYFYIVYEKIQFISLVVIFIELSLSYLISSKGIQRMKAHNNKLIASIEFLYNKEKDK